MDQCNGHGTHVAGIIGADARKLNIETPFVGVAPGVFLGAYRVLSCEGYGPDDVILKVCYSYSQVPGGRWFESGE
jgi:subtilisin family serine protease